MSEPPACASPSSSGTRGDAQPVVVLARELTRRGHDVVGGLPPDLVGWADNAGLPSLPFGPDTQAVLESPEGQGWLASGDVRAFVKALSAISLARSAETRAETRHVVDGADVVVAGILAEDVAVPAAEAVGATTLALHTAPFRRTSAVAAPMVTTASLPGSLNRLTGAVFEAVWWRGLERDYGVRRPLVGFLGPDEAMRVDVGDVGVDPDLDAWLSAGDPPAPASICASRPWTRPG